MNKNTNLLVIIRGPSSNGKSTFANYLTSLYGEKAAVCEADMFFSLDGEYKFDASKLGEAHSWCRESCELFMQTGHKLIIVSNTSTRLKEFNPYLELADKYGYKKIVMTLEKYHQGTNQHGLTNEMIQKQAARFEHKLI